MNILKTIKKQFYWNNPLIWKITLIYSLLVIGFICSMLLDLNYAIETTREATALVTQARYDCAMSEEIYEQICMRSPWTWEDHFYNNWHLYLGGTLLLTARIIIFLSDK